MKDVLVFTPVLRLEAETVEGIFSLEWGGALSILLQRDNPFMCEDKREQAIRNHLHQYQRGREVFLQGSYEGMLVIESDIIPPVDTLTRLVTLDADLAYGCYQLRAGPVVNVFERYPDPARNVGESLSVRGLWNAAVRQGIIECSGGGLGCTLIRRHVLEQVGFRLEWPDNGSFCDHWFTEDVFRMGFSMRADARLWAGHKTPEGVTLWPAGVN